MDKNRRNAFIFYNDDKSVLGSCQPEKLPIHKAAVIEKSIYFFHDPEPCFIRQNAAVIRILEEIIRYLQIRDEPISIHTLPEAIRGYLDLGKEVFYIGYCSYK